MKKQYVKIGLIISIILGMLLCTGCKNLRKVYWIMIACGIAKHRTYIC